MSTLCTAEHRQVRELPRKMNISLGPDVAGTPKSTRISTKNRLQFPRKIDFSSWAGSCRRPKSAKITTKNEHQFLGRMLLSQKSEKSTSFIVKPRSRPSQNTEKYENYHEKRTSKKLNEPKKYQNYQAKPVSDPFKSTAEHREVQELPRKMNIEEVEEPEIRKIHRQNSGPTAAAPKVRKFTHKTNMQT